MTSEKTPEPASPASSSEVAQSAEIGAPRDGPGASEAERPDGAQIRSSTSTTGDSDLLVAATPPQRKPGRIRQAFVAVAWSLALGFLCASLFAIVVQPGARPALVVRAAFWLAANVAESPASRGAVAAFVLGLAQAAITFVALGLIALATTLRPAVAACGGFIAGALPSLMVLMMQGLDAMLPRRILAARIAAALLGALAGFAGVALARRLAHRPLPQP